MTDNVMDSLTSHCCWTKLPKVQEIVKTALFFPFEPNLFTFDLRYYSEVHILKLEIKKVEIV